MIVGINCGHTVSGTVGSGAVGYLNESNETRRVGFSLIEKLRGRGVTVIDCTNDRASTVNENLNNIVSMANAQPLDLFVSIHFNSGGGKGVEVFTNNGTKYTEAVNVCNALNALGFVNRGVKDGSKLAVVRRTNAKAMLIEVCFVDTQSDADLYNHIGADAIADAIAKAITGQAIENKEELTMEQYNELKQEIAEIKAKMDKINDVNGGTMIYNYIDGNMPEWAREGVQWLVDKDILAGTGEGLNLNSMKLWTCVVLYRTAKALLKIVGVKI